MEKRRNCSYFSSFPHYFIYIFLTSGVKLHIHLLNVVVQFIVFLTPSTLICRGTDISKCFSESLAIPDKESRLYIQSYAHFHTMTKTSVQFQDTRYILSEDVELIPRTMNHGEVNTMSPLFFKKVGDNSVLIG